MQQLLKEFIHQILSEARIKNIDIIPGQILSVISEHAVVQGLGGSASFTTAINDKLVAPYFDDLVASGVAPTKIKDYKMVMEEIYNDCVMLTQESQEMLGFAVENVSGGNVGATTAKVDVIVTGKQGRKRLNADVHVKYNDPARLIGLQADAVTKEASKKIVLNAARLAGELDESWPAAAKYKFLRNQFITMKGGMEFVPPKDVKTTSAIEQYGKKRELAVLQEPDNRKRFLRFLDKNGLPEQILKEVSQFFSSTGKAVFFYKFYTSPESINIKNFGPGDGPQIELHVNKIIASSGDLNIVNNIDQPYKYGSTCLYIIQHEGQDVFYIEARTSKSGHPMQIKMVKDAIYDAIFTDNQYEIITT